MSEELLKPYLQEKKRLAFFLMIISTILTMSYYLFRSGFENPLMVPIKALLLSYFIVVLPFLLSAYIYEKWHLFNTLSSDASMSLICLGIALVAQDQGEIFSKMVLLIGGAIGGWGIKFAIANRHTYKSVKCILGMSVFAIAFTGLLWGSDYQSPLFFERIVVDGGKLDTIFHAAIANMLMTQLSQQEIGK